MIVNKMDDLLMDINAIKDIEEIEFSELIPTNKDDYMMIIPCLYVRYNSGKVLNLCSNDKYFDIFVKKVLEVYRLEKDRVIEDDYYDPFKISKLKINDKTKKILESGVLTKINEIYGLYDSKNSYEYNLLIEKDEVKSLLPLLTYQIKKLYSITDITITFDEIELIGYRNNYTISCKINGIDDIIYLKYKKIDNDKYSFSVRSKNKDFSSLMVDIIFKKENIKIKMNSKDYNLALESEYLVEDNNLRFIERVNLNDRQVVYENKLLESTENKFENITDIDNFDKMTWYLLPWNGLFGISNNMVELSSTDGIREVHVKYLMPYDNNYALREYYGKSYYRNRTFEIDNYNVILDECVKSVNYVLLYDNVYLIETMFSDNGHENGYYQTYLDNKYYYHLLDSNKGFKREYLVPISRYNDIIYGADLEDKDKVMKLVRGNK